MTVVAIVRCRAAGDRAEWAQTHNNFLSRAAGPVASDKIQAVGISEGEWVERHN